MKLRIRVCVALLLLICLCNAESTPPTDAPSSSSPEPSAIPAKPRKVVQISRTEFCLGTSPSTNPNNNDEVMTMMVDVIIVGCHALIEEFYLFARGNILDHKQTSFDVNVDVCIYISLAIDGWDGWDGV
jgi:hypothetical protein